MGRRLVVSLWLLILLRRILVICLRLLRRGRIGSRRLVRRLSWWVRADWLRWILVLGVLALRGVLSVGLSNTLGWDKRLLLLGLLVLLGFHGNRLNRGRFIVKQESTSLAALEEAVQSPDKGCDEEKPDQGSEASDGGKHVTTRLEEDNVTLLDKVALLVACLAVKQAAVVEAAVDPDIEAELGALGSHGGEGCKPEDHHDTVKDDDGNDMVELVQSWQLLTQDNVQADEPCDDSNSQSETFLVKVGIMHQTSSQGKDDERDENLENTANEHPEGGDQHVAGFVFRLLHDEGVYQV